MSQITTHVLDTSQGRPAAGIAVVLYQAQADEWRRIGAGITDSDGRVADLPGHENVLPAGNYKIRFDTASYFTRLNLAAFYPCIEIVFQIQGDGQHYHVPLLLNPFGYATYRGS